VATVASIMSRRVVAAVATHARVGPDDDITRAVEVMLDELVDAVPVADRTGRVVGVVTWSDIVAHVAGEHLGQRPSTSPST
jgi:CBS-domain-containing membrane protein